MKHGKVFLSTVALAFCIAGEVQAQTWTGQTVGAQQDIFKADGNGPALDGLDPSSFTLSAGTSRTLTFQSVVGSWQCYGGSLTAGPDGIANCAGSGTNINSSNKIAGIQMPTQMPLVGLFLGGGLPASAPSELIFSSLASLDFTSLAPQLGQVFFIGDGRTSTNVFQQFLVPDGATTLYLGVADAFSFTGDPGYYSDNSGSMSASFMVEGGTNAAPEPVTTTLLVTGLGGLAALRRRRRAAA